jgi:predicted DNA-binding protein
MKGELPVVGGRVPHVLKDKLTAFCIETGQTESQVIRDALSAYLGVNTPETVCDRSINGSLHWNEN